MKKALFAAFAGLCILTSVMSTSVNAGKTYGYQKTDRLILSDTIPASLIQPGILSMIRPGGPYLIEENK